MPAHQRAASPGAGVRGRSGSRRRSAAGSGSPSCGTCPGRPTAVGAERAAAQHLVVRRRRTPPSTPGTATRANPGYGREVASRPLPDVADQLRAPRSGDGAGRVGADRRRAAGGAGRGWRARRSGRRHPTGTGGTGRSPGRTGPPSPTRPRWAAAPGPRARTRRPRTSTRAAPARPARTGSRRPNRGAATAVAVAPPEQRRGQPGLAAGAPSRPRSTSAGRRSRRRR